jgi:CheY-like chemotaxis protein
MKKIKDILLVDDDYINNFINQYLFKKLGVSDRIIDLTSGNAAIGYLETCTVISKVSPELILVDIDMPDLDGFKFIKQFYRLSFENADRIQLVILTNSINALDRERMEALGITSIINKPLTEEKILEILEHNQVQKNN